MVYPYLSPYLCGNKKKVMNYQKLSKSDSTKNVSIVLTMEEIKILHNACIDILNQNPEMVSYQKAQQSLEDIILYNENKLK